MDDDEQRALFPVPIGESLPKIKRPSRVQQRLIDSAAAIATDDPQTLLFQHTVFCQAGCRIAIRATTSESGSASRAPWR